MATDRRAWTLFALALIVYLVTRLVALDRFPIFFHADEAFGPLMAADLLRNGLTDAYQRLLPVYFEPAPNRWMPIGTVYAHLLTVALWGKHIVVTRATTAVVTAAGAGAVALILRDAFGSRLWWAGVLVIGAMPTWFIHSRTGFEAAMMTASFAVFLWSYVRYRRDGGAAFACAAVGAGAATFYAYSNGQSLMAVLGLSMIVVDARHHWAQRRALLPALVLAPLEARVPAATPFLMLGNRLDIQRHRYRGRGHIALWMLPFFFIGLIAAVRRWRSPAERTVLLAILAAPVGAALADIGITRVMALVVPAAILVTLGLEAVAEWVGRRLAATRARRRWPVLDVGVASTSVATLCFVGLAGANVELLTTALRAGPRWYDDYGLYGMQWGAKQLFEDVIPALLRSDPNVNVMLTSDWANAADRLPYFFLSADDVRRVRSRSVSELMLHKVDWTDDPIWIVTDHELDGVRASGKFDPPLRYRAGLRAHFAYMPFTWTIELYAPDAADTASLPNAAKPVTYTQTYANVPDGDVHGDVDFDRGPVVVARMRITIHQDDLDDEAHIHVRELVLR